MRCTVGAEDILYARFLFSFFVGIQILFFVGSMFESIFKRILLLLGG